MQPIHLKLYNKLTNTISAINGYEITGTSGTTIRTFDMHYVSTHNLADIKILRCIGIKDHTSEYLFEGDAVIIIKDKEAFRGIVTFLNGAFICEGLTSLLLEWPHSSQIRKIGNIFTNPLVLKDNTL